MTEWMDGGEDVVEVDETDVMGEWFGVWDRNWEGRSRAWT